MKSLVVTFRFTICLTLLVCLCPLAISTASQPTAKFDTLDAKLELILPDTIVVGDTFWVIFNVTILQPIKHFNDVPDKIAIRLPSCCAVDSGSTEWTGYLEDSVSVSLSLRAYAVHSCLDFFEGYIYAGCVPLHTNYYGTRGRTGSKYYQISTAGEREPSRPDADSVRIRVSDIAAPHPGIRLLGFHVDSTDTLLPLGIRHARQFRTQVLSLDSLKTGRVVLTYEAGIDNFFYVIRSAAGRDKAEQKAIGVVVEAISPGLAIEISRNGSYLFTMSPATHEGQLIITVDSVSYSIHVQRQEKRL